MNATDRRPLRSAISAEHFTLSHVPRAVRAKPIVRAVCGLLCLLLLPDIALSRDLNFDEEAPFLNSVAESLNAAAGGTALNEYVPASPPYALEVWGTDHLASPSRIVWNLFNVDIPVTSDLRLEYKINPRLYTGKSMTVDLTFVDAFGVQRATLRQSGAVDQFGVPVTPAAQSTRVVEGEYNHVISTFGSLPSLQGLRVRKVQVVYESSAAGGGSLSINALFDDIKLYDPNVPEVPTHVKVTGSKVDQAGASFSHLSAVVDPLGRSTCGPVPFDIRTQSSAVRACAPPVNSYVARTQVSRGRFGIAARIPVDQDVLVSVCSAGGRYGCQEHPDESFCRPRQSKTRAAIRPLLPPGTPPSLVGIRWMYVPETWAELSKYPPCDDSGMPQWIRTVTLPLSTRQGDVNQDDSITVSDGVQALRCAAGAVRDCQGGFNVRDCPLYESDLDCSATVTVTDGVRVLRKAAGLDLMGGETCECTGEGTFGRWTVQEITDNVREIRGCEPIPQGVILQKTRDDMQPCGGKVNDFLYSTRINATGAPLTFEGEYNQKLEFWVDDVLKWQAPFRDFQYTPLTAAAPFSATFAVSPGEHKLTVRTNSSGTYPGSYNVRIGASSGGGDPGGGGGSGSWTSWGGTGEGPPPYQPPVMVRLLLDPTQNLIVDCPVRIDGRCPDAVDSDDLSEYYAWTSLAGGVHNISVDSVPGVNPFISICKGCYNHGPWSHVLSNFASFSYDGTFVDIGVVYLGFGNEMRQRGVDIVDAAGALSGDGVQTNAEDLRFGQPTLDCPDGIFGSTSQFCMLGAWPDCFIPDLQVNPSVLTWDQWPGRLGGTMQPDAVTQIANAMNKWGDAGPLVVGNPLVLPCGGGTGLPCDKAVTRRDGKSTIAIVDPNQPIEFATPTGSKWMSLGLGHFVGHTAIWDIRQTRADFLDFIVEVDIAIRRDQIVGRLAEVSSTGLHWFHNVVLHEYGHALGLGHTTTSSIMLQGISPNQANADMSLVQEDRNGLEDLYFATCP